MPRRQYLSYRGVVQTIAKWSKDLGIPQSTIHTRLKKGASVEQALSSSYRHIKRLKKSEDKQLTIQATQADTTVKYVPAKAEQLVAENYLAKQILESMRESESSTLHLAKHIAELTGRIMNCRQFTLMEMPALDLLARAEKLVTRLEEQTSRCTPESVMGKFIKELHEILLGTSFHQPV